MKHIIICLIAFTTLACSPKHDPAEQRMKRHFIAQQLLQNQYFSNNIIEEAGPSQHPSVLAALQGNQIVSSFRNEYLAHQSVDGLIKYADAILKGYDTLSEKDERISEAIKTYQKTVLNAGDSVSIENLYWHTLYAENALFRQFFPRSR